MKDTKIISAFPATGKTWFKEQFFNTENFAMDSDSSKFSWMPDGITRDSTFPDNYIENIKMNIGRYDYIFVSSHKEVRQAMNEQIARGYTLIYPHESLIKEYIKRFVERKNDVKFVDFVCKNWFAWIEDMKKEDCKQKIQLLSGQYVSDVLVF